MYDTTLWTAVRYLTCHVLARVRAVRDSDRQSGALSLEWLIIAGVIAAAAIAVGVIFTAKVNDYANNLP
jgi:Flp pilus assembly pilin Flp